MTGKHTRLDMIGALNHFCIKNRLPCVTYIEKRRKSELEAIVAQYDINVDEMNSESAKAREKVENFIPELQKTIKKHIDGFADKIQMLESLLNEEQKEKYLEYCDSQKSNELNIADEEVVDV